MKKVLIPVHTGFEETELITTINVFKRNNIEYILWSVEGIDIVRSSHDAMVMTLPIFPNHEEFDALFLPGGSAVEQLIEMEEITELAKEFWDKGKVVSAICAAPKILNNAGILDNQKFTAFPGTNLKNNTLEDVVESGKLLTGRDYTITQKFAELLAKKIIAI